MLIIKKNIWSLFLLFFILATTFLITASYSHWNEVYKDTKLQNENFTKLIAKSSENYFEQLEVILELLGAQLLENNNYKNIDTSKKLIKKMLDMNSSIIAYALISPSGKYLLTHLDEPVDNIPGVFTREAARDSFIQTLKSKKMIIGRTYFLNRTKRMAIPIRKAFFDENGKPIAVVSVAIPVDNSNLFDEKILKTYSHVIHLFREDLYRQLYIYRTEDEKIEDIYTKPLPKKANEAVNRQFIKKYNLTREEIKQKEMTVTFDFENRVNNIRYLISTQYMKDYELWASSYVRYDEIVSAFFKKFNLYILIYFSVMLVVWLLFRYIYRIEENQKKLLEYRANHDDLTRLPNRYYLNQYFKTWSKDKKEYSLIYIDLDNFKYVNDNFGHKIGDEVIIKVTTKIKNSLDSDDLFIRQSGDEFIVLTKNCSEIEEYCKSIIRSINEKFELDNKEFKINASLGVASFPKDSDSIDELIICSDIACYNAKKVRNTFKVFTHEIKESHYEVMEIEKELKLAIDKKEIFLAYQPQINYDKSIHGVETLVRWNNEKLGNVRPDKFIQIAESIGFMPVLGDYIIERSLKEIKSLQDKTSKNFQLSINISVKQFVEANFVDKLMKKIDKYKVDPNLVTLEITESVLIDNMEYMIELFNKLRKIGFTISLDDFGTGYSSLSMLKNVPINELKIDKAFIDDITHDESAQHMVKTIITIGKILNYHIVLAEGVETKNQVELLNEFGCDTYQGYYYSKPLSIDALEKFITKNKFND